MSPGRGNVEVASRMRARAAAVVGHGDDRGEVDVGLLETAEEEAETGAAADRDDVEFRPAGPKRSPTKISATLRPLVISLRRG